MTACIEDEIVANQNNYRRLNMRNGEMNRLLSGHLTLSVFNTSDHASDIGREAFKSHVDALAQLVSRNKKTG